MQSTGPHSYYVTQCVTPDHTFSFWGRFEATGKYYNDIFEERSPIRPRGGERTDEARGLDLRSQRSAGDGWDGGVQREVRPLQYDSADGDTDPLMQLNVFRPTFHV